MLAILCQMGDVFLWPDSWYAIYFNIWIFQFPSWIAFCNYCGDYCSRIGHTMILRFILFLYCVSSAVL